MKANAKALAEDGLSESRGDIPEKVMDDKERRDFKKEFEKLREQLDEAKEFKRERDIERIEEEMQNLHKAYNMSIKLGGESSEFRGARNTAVNTVGRTVKRAINIIKSKNDECGQHFEDKIHIGTKSHYYKPGTADIIPPWTP